ncbi:GNAT family N-acetyltransferase [Larkinella sp. VNQ87]|uniref:GNAT family N-acetyltransferase n=1 Tax=Larkinella sp. VNQ87 TaxID=3400921 RepID=UPI003C0A171F
MNALSLLRTTASDPVFHELITQLDQDLWSRYQPYQAKYDGFNKVDASARVVVVRQCEQAIGCGCFRPMTEPGFVEIKRMFVVPAFRGQGLALQLLEELERWAKEDGFRTARLETGNKQPEAVRMYEKAGYIRIANYGPYVGMETSICLEKRLI